MSPAWEKAGLWGRFSVRPGLWPSIHPHGHQLGVQVARIFQFLHTPDEQRDWHAVTALSLWWTWTVSFRGWPGWARHGSGLGCEVSKNKHSFRSCRQMRMYSFSFFFLILFIFRERERKGERERNINVWLPLMCPLHRRPGLQPQLIGTCPDWELNRQHFGSQASTQSTGPHQPGPFSFLKLYFIVY